MNDIESMLHQLEVAHRKLLEAFPSSVHEIEFIKIREGVASELGRINPEDFHRKPAENEWSAKKVMEHIITHDQRHQEVETRGLGHYVDHGREHVGQLAEISRFFKKQM